MTSNGVWKWVAGTLATLLIAGLAGTVTAYVGLSRDVVPRKEIAEMIQVHCPYGQDRKMILSKLTDISASVGRQKDALDTLSRETARLSALIEAQQAGGSK